MSRVKVSFHFTDYTKKPSAYEINSIESDLLERGKSSYKRNDIKSFVKMVAEEGHAFSAATFEFDFLAAQMEEKNFEQLQLFTLDFAGEITFEDVKEKADLYDLPILFAYEPFAEDGRFRAVFLNDVPVTDLRAARAMQRALMTIFPEADPVSKKLMKIYLGGRKLLHFDPSIPEINIEALFRGMSFALMDRHGKTNYRRKITEFSKDTGIRLNRNNLPDISIEEIKTDNEMSAARAANISNDNISPLSIIIQSSIENGEKLSKRYQINFNDSTSAPSISKPRTQNHREYRPHNLRSLGSTCQLFQEFQSEDRHLTPTELFGLATNLVQIEAGAARFKSILKSKSYFDDRPKKYSAWDYTLFYIRDYAPSVCEGYCPYRDSCTHHGSNILSTTKPRMERLAVYAENFHPIEEVEQDVERAIFEAHRIHRAMMQVVKAQTAIGKTTSYFEADGREPLGAVSDRHPDEHPEG
jgi:hypothetical protein